MDQLLKNLRKYFIYLETHYLKWHESLEKTVKPLRALSNLTEQLQIVVMVGRNEIDIKLPDVKSKLISKIKTGIEEEITLLYQILKELDTTNRELKNRFETVENSCEMVEYSDLLEASNHPPASNMVEWAGDAWRLYHTFYIQIYGAMKCLKYEDETSILNLQEAFHEDPEMKQHIQRILFYTKTVTKESSYASSK